MNKDLKVLIYNYKAEFYEEKLREKYPELIIRSWTGKKDIDDFIEKADIIMCWKLTDELLKKAVNLKWLQLTSTGCDQIITLSEFKWNILLSTAGGVHAIPIAEYVICYILSLYHKTFDFMKFQMNKTWKILKPLEIKDKTLGLIGLGNIGKEIAKKAKAFDMKVVGIKRTQEEVKYVDKIFTDLDEVMKISDFIVLAVPFTEKTKNLIGKRELYLMKPGAYLINIARGEILDEKALFEILKNRKIAGAVLDVFEHEPLEEDSELWELDNIVITPHISWLGENTNERVAQVLIENMGLYLEGKEVNNTVLREKGY